MAKAVGFCTPFKSYVRQQICSFQIDFKILVLNKSQKFRINKKYSQTRIVPTFLQGILDALQKFWIIENYGFSVYVCIIHTRNIIKFIDCASF